MTENRYCGASHFETLLDWREIWAQVAATSDGFVNRGRSDLAECVHGCQPRSINLSHHNVAVEL
jgi:hypothetical protein